MLKFALESIDRESPDVRALVTYYFLGWANRYRFDRSWRERNVLMDITRDGIREIGGDPRMAESPRINIIIPTKNRAADLQATVKSIFAQTFAPVSLLIVDQSSDDEARRGVANELALAEARRACGWELNYSLDPRIVGASAARNHAMRLADGDIWLFLDDDVVLEPDFIEQLLLVYRDYPHIGGVSGIITNYRCLPLPYRLWSKVFVRGPFRDERQKIYWNADRLRNSPPIPVRHFTGALMSFRSRVVRNLFFDESLDQNFRGVSDGEDIAFCEKLGNKVELRIAPRARLRHNHSSVCRLTDHWLRRHARANLYLYKAYWNKRVLDRLDYGWLRIGYWFVATVASARRLSFEPWRALFLGAQEANQVFIANTSQLAESQST
jgi:GT2 family glycosyltransferase